MGIWEKEVADLDWYEKPEDRALVTHLSYLAQGVDPRTHQMVSPAVQQAAVQQYISLRDRINAARLQAEDIRNRTMQEHMRTQSNERVELERIRRAAETERMRIEGEQRLQAERVHLDQAKLQIEAGRVMNERLQIVMAGLQALAAADPGNVEVLKPMFERLGTALVGAESLPLLTDKKDT